MNDLTELKGRIRDAITTKDVSDVGFIMNDLSQIEIKLKELELLKAKVNALLAVVIVDPSNDDALFGCISALMIHYPNRINDVLHKLRGKEYQAKVDDLTGGKD